MRTHPRRDVFTRACLGAALLSTLAAAGCQGVNHPPGLALVDDQYVLVGETLRVTLVGEDLDGDALRFSVEGLPDSARVEAQSPVSALLTWSPTITETDPGGRTYTARAVVRDGQGGEASQAFSVNVFPVFGVPAFDLPAGVALNLASDDDLTLQVTVKDDDSTEVAITLVEAPDGAKLSKAGPKSALFFWAPDEAQRLVSVHRLVFGARDESHGLQTHTVLVVLLNADVGAGCVGTPPRVTFAPPADARQDEGPLRFEAVVTDLDSAVAAVELQWTLGDPAGGTETLALTRDAVDRSLWRGELLPANVPPTGAHLRYRLLARDNDDPIGTACDKVTRVPKSGWLGAAVYGPGAALDACLDDDAEPDDTQSSAPTLGAGLHGGRRLCGPGLDLARVELAAGQSLSVGLSRPPGLGLPTLRLLDAAGATVDEASGETPVLVVEDPSGLAGPRFIEVQTADPLALTYALDIGLLDAPCADDALEDNDSAAAAVDGPTGTTDDLVICPGDDDWYRYTLQPGERLETRIELDVKLGDLDLALQDPATGETLAEAATPGSTEVLAWTAPMGSPRTLALRVTGYQGASNAYRLTARIIAAADVCADDILGDHGTSDRAILLFSGLYENLTACPTRPDWYAVDLNGGETLGVLVEPLGAGPIDVAIFDDPAAAPAGTDSAGSGGLAEVSQVASGPGRLFYRISAASAAGYVMLQAVEDPPGPCQPDRFEPNDDPATAPLLSPGVHTWLRLCGDGDSDAFRVELEAFETLTVFTAHAPGEGYTDATILAPDGSTVADALDPYQGVEVSALAESAGTYTVVLTPFEVSALGYDLALLVE